MTIERADPRLGRSKLNPDRIVGLLLFMVSFAGPFTVVAGQDHEPDLQLAPVPGGEIEYEVRGRGEPVLLIHGSFVPRTFLPLMDAPELEGYRLIRMHRRGYGGSSTAGDAFSIEQDAADARALLDFLGVERAHIVGHSAGAIVAMELAFSAPERVQSLTLMDPPLGGWMQPRVTPPRDTSAPADSTNAFMTRVIGPEWRSSLEPHLPGAAEEAAEYIHRMYVVEIPALGAWEWSAAKAARVVAPILFIAPRRKPSVGLAEGWWPEMEYREMPGTTHVFPIEDPAGTARHLADFLGRHPM